MSGYRPHPVNAPAAAVTMLSDARFVDEGDIITSAGVSAGIDMALHVVARLYGEAVAAQTVRRMEYRYERPASG